MLALIRQSINNPVAVLALMGSVFLFGLVALASIPIQMTPDIEKPIHQVRVSWPGASPEDVDREIVSRLENELGSLGGVEKIESRSFTGSARITLTYSLKQDMDEALVTLLGKLSGIGGLPAESRRPTVRTSNSDDSPIARLALVSLPPAGGRQAVDLERLGRFLQTGVIEPLGRVNGVTEVFVYGGGDKELRLLLDPEELRRYRLGVAEVVNAIRGASLLASVGTIEEGKRVFTVRLESQAHTPETARRIIIRNEVTADGSVFPLFLEDVAEIEYDVQKRTSFRRLNGEDTIIVNILREQGSNVVATMERLRGEVNRLNEADLAPRGMQLRIVYDETEYISSAIDLVRQNIFIGGLLAFCVLMLFLRSVLPTVIIFIAIPVSVVGTFVAIAGLGLSINVISLAGLAFAVGMVVDASIVSLENIYRLRQRGMAAPEAAFNGSRQVWAPILGASLTTVIVFIPVLAIDLPVGQLFRDIGIAISVAVLISAVVSVTVIPSIAARLLAGRADRFASPRPLPRVDRPARRFSEAVIRHAGSATARRGPGLLVVAGILAVSVGAALVLMPKLDYLPDGNANFVFGRLQVPPGYSLNETNRIARKMEVGARPLWEAETAVDGMPAIERFFFVSWGGGAFAGASAKDASRVSELRGVLTRPLNEEPGARAFVRQASLFGRSVGGSRSIKVIVSGPDLDRIEPVVRRLDRMLNARFPRSEGNQIRVRPSLNSQVAQIRVTPDRLALARAGFNARDFANTVDVFNDGLVVQEIPIDGELVDLVLASTTATRLSIDGLAQLPVVSPRGDVYRLAHLAEVDVVNAPVEILRFAGRQVMELQVRPDERITLEEAVTVIEEALEPFRNPELRRRGIGFQISGAAGDLAEAWALLKTNLLVVVVVIYMLLAILLRSFLLPAIIVTVIPVAAAGGVFGLAVMNLFTRQSLDMLTMLGFIILMGVVVNNAILMVEQAILHIREESMAVPDAIVEATRNRIRPIFMSSMTSLFGLVPLVVFPGAGAELYRGIGAVVFGGLALSMLATLVIVPPLLAVFAPVLQRVANPDRALGG